MKTDVKKEGLKIKYIIKKVDGSPVDPEAKYFVLRYDSKMKDKEFLKASRKALAAFIKETRETFPKLSQELMLVLSGEILKDV